ncbi:MAG: hypothetical protein K9J25_00005 [Bacteroidales bacterium]|nr:hypothetical protein [Bacteroidales bacterium]
MDHAEKNEQNSLFNCYIYMRTKSKIRNTIKVLYAAFTVIITQVAVYAQQPTHYPGDNDPIPPTLVNILIYIGGPLLLFLAYYYFNKKEKKKREDRRKDEGTK